VAFPFRIIDLTHTIHPGMPLWPGDPETRRDPVASPEREGWLLHSWTLSEHLGTHFGAPSHFHAEGEAVDSFSADRLVSPAVVVEVPKLANDSNRVGVADLLTLEEECGCTIPTGAMVLLRTGWSRFWQDADKVFARDRQGAFLWPGFGVEAVEWLVRERKVCGLGSDAPGIDPGDDEQFHAGKLCAGYGLPHLENLANLEAMPHFGGWLIISPLLLKGGSGSPARVMGLIP